MSILSQLKLHASRSKTCEASHNFTVEPCDNRCRFWCKIIRAEDNLLLPMPSDVEGANDIPVSYTKKGDEEIFIGDIVIEGEENSHRKMRGWSYAIHWLDTDGHVYSINNPGTEVKATLKECGIDKKLLAGAGMVAACIRVAHAVQSELKTYNQQVA